MLTDPIGLIGTGNIGAALVRRLSAAGLQLVVHDRNAAAANALAGDCVRVAASPRAVADLAPTVLVCLAMPEASVEVAEAAAGGGALRHWIEVSTLPPETMNRISAIMAPHNVGVADAPVSGGPSAIAEGRLSVILSGPASAIEAARSALDPAASEIFVVGEHPGAAQTCKLVNNAISLSMLALTSEAMVVGVKAGIDPEMLLRVINAGSGMSAASRDKFPKAILSRSFDYGGRLGMAPKDLNAFLDAARRVGAPTPLVAAAEQIWQAAIASVGGERDFTEVVKLYELWAGVEIGHR